MLDTSGSLLFSTCSALTQNSRQVNYFGHQARLLAAHQWPQRAIHHGFRACTRLTGFHTVQHYPKP